MRHIHWLMTVSLTKARTLPVVVLGCGWSGFGREFFNCFFNIYYYYYYLI